MIDRGARAHLEDGAILAHLDGELPGDVSARVAEHLSECADCRRRWEELSTSSALLSRELDALDAPPPRRSADEIRRGAEAREEPDVTSGGRGSFAARRGLLWKAAVLVLGAATAAGAMVPGSPVRGWIAQTVRAVSGVLSDEEVPESAGAEALATPRPQDAGLQGVTIPVTDSAVVEVPEAPAGLRIRVRSIRGGLLSVTGRGARYRAGSGRIRVTPGGAEELHVALPVSAGTVRITARGIPLVAGTGRDLRFLAARIDTTENAYVVHVPSEATGNPEEPEP